MSEQNLGAEILGFYAWTHPLKSRLLVASCTGSFPLNRLNTVTTSPRMTVTAADTCWPIHKWNECFVCYPWGVYHNGDQAGEGNIPFKPGPPATLLLNFWVGLSAEERGNGNTSMLACLKGFLLYFAPVSVSILYGSAITINVVWFCEILRFILTNQGLYLNLSTS